MLCDTNITLDQIRDLEEHAARFGEWLERDN